MGDVADRYLPDCGITIGEIGDIGDIDGDQPEADDERQGWLGFGGNQVE